MDPRWQIPLDHPPCTAPGREAQELLAAGWTSSPDESWLDGPRQDLRRLAAPHTWHTLRELGARLPTPVRMQWR